MKKLKNCEDINRNDFDVFYDWGVKYNQEGK